MSSEAKKDRSKWIGRIKYITSPNVVSSIALLTSILLGIYGYQIQKQFRSETRAETLQAYRGTLDLIISFEKEYDKKYGSDLTVKTDENYIKIQRLDRYFMDNPLHKSLWENSKASMNYNLKDIKGDLSAQKNIIIAMKNVQKQGHKEIKGWVYSYVTSKENKAKNLKQAAFLSAVKSKADNEKIIINNAPSVKRKFPELLKQERRNEIAFFKIANHTKVKILGLSRYQNKEYPYYIIPDYSALTKPQNSLSHEELLLLDRCFSLERRIKVLTCLSKKTKHLLKK